MKSFAFTFAVVACTLCSIKSYAQNSDKWTAISTTAMGITGDIKTTPDSLLISGHKFELKTLRPLSAVELKLAADLFTAKIYSTSAGSIARTFIPRQTKLQGVNTACGKQDVNWIVILRDRSGTTENLQIAMFSGTTEPDLRPYVLNQSRDLCGTYWYQRQLEEKPS